MKKIDNDFRGRDIVSLDQFAPSDLNLLFALAKKMGKIAISSKPAQLLGGKMVTLLFYEPSSRTFGSFAAAVKLLGGQTIEILDPQHFSSVSKGETLEDTIRTFEAYSDAIVMRHPVIGTATKAAAAAEVPLINAGDGNGEHPTQALLDLYTIYEKFGQLDNLTGLLAGDVLNSRAIHSLIRGLSLFKKNTLYLLSPKELKLTRADLSDFKQRDVQIIEITDEKDIPKNANFWYWTRVQKERFTDMEAYEKVKLQFVVTPSLMDRFAGRDMILMDPLPRIQTIDMAVDADPRAVYLRSQIRNGLYIRMALLALVLGVKV